MRFSSSLVEFIPYFTALYYYAREGQASRHGLFSSAGQGGCERGEWLFLRARTQSTENKAERAEYRPIAGPVQESSRGLPGADEHTHVAQELPADGHDQQPTGRFAA